VTSETRQGKKRWKKQEEEGRNFNFGGKNSLLQRGRKEHSNAFSRKERLTAHSSIEDTANARLIVIQASDCVQARLTHTITFRRSVPFP
jgi:hypothetical protein